MSLIATTGGTPVGAVTFTIDNSGGCELMSINATCCFGGIGSKLLSFIEEEARAAGYRRVRLITSNDNLAALRFYQRRSYRISGIYPGAIDEARRVKPEIPLVGYDGIEIHDEIELQSVSQNITGLLRRIAKNATRIKALQTCWG